MSQGAERPVAKLASSVEAKRIASESIGIQLVKVLLYGAAAFVFSQIVGTETGFISSLVAVTIAALLAEVAHRRGMRGIAVVLLGGGLAALFGFFAALVRSSFGIASSLGVEGTVALSEVLYFGAALGAIVFVVRFGAKRARVIGALEIIGMTLAMAYVFMEHRGCNLIHPRDFVDWLLARGEDPIVWLRGIGCVIMAVGIFLLLRGPGAAKLALSTVIAVGTAALVFVVIRDDVVECNVKDVNTAKAGDDESDKGGKDDDEDGKGGKGDGKGGKGDGKGGGSGNSKSPYAQTPPNNKPQPVALVTFHDDFESPDGILYFRQQVLSNFDQTHLVNDASGRYDQDVIQKFPTNGPVAAATTQNVDTHKKVPTAMFLMADHPQPVALSHASELRPVENPNPRLFLASYGVTSLQLSVDFSRFLGRKSVPDSWTPEQKAHYLAYPDDPRYLSLADELVRDVGLRFQGEDIVKALAIKEYLEEKGFYTLKETHVSETDPTAGFLFGSMRGYCVHFAHSAVFLLRSQGIAARVAVGYGVDTSRRGSGSSMLILGNQAHAWPEIHVEGIGWVTFDIYPKHSDQPPNQVVDQDLANMLGEMARNDPTGGRSANPDTTPFPWDIILWVIVGIAGSLVVAAYSVKGVRRLMPLFAPERAAHRWAVRAAMDRFADLGLVREFGETREHFAARMNGIAPSLANLTMAHLRAALGGSGRGAPVTEVRRLYRDTRGEVRRNVRWNRRLAAFLNPLGWLWSR